MIFPSNPSNMKNSTFKPNSKINWMDIRIYYSEVGFKTIAKSSKGKSIVIS